MEIKFKKTLPCAQVPTYATAGAACFDIYSSINAYVNHGSVTRVPTGLVLEIPPGMCVLVFSRSGHGVKRIRLANGVGVIDSDYRGELQVLLTLDDPGNVFRVTQGDRIAQGMLVPVIQASFVEAEQLSETERGTGGFGSTGA